MACQICGAKSGFFPMCKKCNLKKDNGKITKCQDCGVWKEGDKPRCLDCYYKNKKSNKKEAPSMPTKEEKDANDFRNKFPATCITADGHRVRSKAEQIIDNWLYHQKIAHAYERKLPIEEDVYCDFFIPLGKVWIEYWGLEESKYKKRKETKKKIYAKHDMKLIELTDKDIEKIDDVMPIKLRPFFPNDFSFD
jgi:hypothetical protein